MQVQAKENINSPCFSIQNRSYRAIWTIAYFLFFRFTPIFFFRYRACILRAFGAQVDMSARVYPSASIWSPKNLLLGKGVTIGPKVKLYNQGHITIRKNAIISQDVSICASTHDYNQSVHPLVLAPVEIGASCWICAEAFIGPGVCLGEGAVIGARTVQINDAEAWFVYGGNPSIKIKRRKLRVY